MAAAESLSTLTVVLVATGLNASNIDRRVREIIAHGDAGVDVVVVSTGPSAAEGVSRCEMLTASTVEEAAAVAAARASLKQDVLLVPASATFRHGWPVEARRQLLVAPECVSHLAGSRGTVLLVPASVTHLSGPRVTWNAPRAIGTVHATKTLNSYQGAQSKDTQRRSVGAVMIVKDEEDGLGPCLDAVLPFVDEVVVYDTGSTDDTVAVAEARGALVVKGYWNDHFGDARNRALQHATCDWVLQVDADDEVTGDVDVFRAFIDAQMCDMVHLPYISLNASGSAGTDIESRPVRLFRRDVVRYQGGLHEYPVFIPGVDHRGVAQAPAPLRVLHYGHQRVQVDGKGKVNAT